MAFSRYILKMNMVKNLVYFGVYTCTFLGIFRFREGDPPLCSVPENGRFPGKSRLFRGKSLRLTPKTDMIRRFSEGKERHVLFIRNMDFFDNRRPAQKKPSGRPESCRIRQTLPEETDFSTEKTRRSKTPGQNHSFYPLLLVVPGPFSAFPARQKRLSRRRSHLSPHLSVSIQLILCLSAACHSALRGYSRKPRTPSSRKKRTVSALPIFFSSVLSAR